MGCLGMPTTNSPIMEVLTFGFRIVEIADLNPFNGSWRPFLSLQMSASRSKGWFTAKHNKTNMHVSGPNVQLTEF